MKVENYDKLTHNQKMSFICKRMEAKTTERITKSKVINAKKDVLSRLKVNQ